MVEEDLVFEDASACSSVAPQERDTPAADAKDEAFLALARDKEADMAWRIFHEQWDGEIRGWIRQWLGNLPQLWDDVRQKVDMRLLAYLDTFDVARAPRPFLKTLVRNLCRDAWRAWERKDGLLVPIEGPVGSSEDSGAWEAPDPTDEPAELEKRDLYERLHFCVEQALAQSDAGEDKKNSFRMRYMDGLKFCEIAVAFGMGETNTVSNWCVAILKTIKDGVVACLGGEACAYGTRSRI